MHSVKTFEDKNMVPDGENNKYNSNTWVWQYEYLFTCIRGLYLHSSNYKVALASSHLTIKLSILHYPVKIRHSYQGPLDFRVHVSPLEQFKMIF